jgi:hypothetical protein
MTTAQTAAHEFLRQFWLAVYPPPGDAPPVPPAQKAAKAARMAGFLARTPEKVDALVREAQRLGIDYAKVETVRGVLPVVGVYGLTQRAGDAARHGRGEPRACVPAVAACRSASEAVGTYLHHGRYSGHCMLDYIQSVEFKVRLDPRS